MTLEAAVKAGAGQMRDRLPQCVETVIQRQERVLAKGHHHRFFFRAQHGRARRFGPHRRIAHRRASFPLGDGLRIDAVLLGQCP